MILVNLMRRMDVAAYLIYMRLYYQMIPPVYKVSVTTVFEAHEA